MAQLILFQDLVVKGAFNHKVQNVLKQFKLRSTLFYFHENYCCVFWRAKIRKIIKLKHKSAIVSSLTNHLNNLRLDTLHHLFALIYLFLRSKWQHEQREMQNLRPEENLFDNCRIIVLCQDIVSPLRVVGTERIRVKHGKTVEVSVRPLGILLFHFLFHLLLVDGFLHLRL